MGLPQDEVMLASFINMKLRDGDYTGLEDLCLSLGIEVEALKGKLKKAGFDFIEGVNQFR